MKKTLLYSFLPILIAMLTCTTFIACGDDDEEDYDPRKDREQFEASKDNFLDNSNDDNDSSNDSDDEDEDEGRNCPSCNNGICTYCNGRGYRTVGKNQIECSGCHGTGDCRRCDGTGEI